MDSHVPVYFLIIISTGSQVSYVNESNAAEKSSDESLQVVG